MDHLASLVRRAAAPLLITSVAVLFLALPVLASPAEASQESNEAAKVAKKVENATLAAHEDEEEREALRDFQEEVAEYAVLHATQRLKLGSREESAATQDALARAIAAKRAKARPGDIFQPGIEALFRRLIAAQLQGPEALAARKAVLEGNPGQDLEEPSVPVVARVNAAYPHGAARSTVPPSLLLTLPALPPSLHYRFVGQDLILIDSVAQIIVDVLPDAAPQLSIQ